MALVLATWRDLERRTATTVRRLLTLQQQEQQLPPSSQSGVGKGKRKGSVGAGVAEEEGVTVEPAQIARAFDTVLRALEERKESRSKWELRFADSVYRSLSPDCAPVVPALWVKNEGDAGGHVPAANGAGGWEQRGGEGPLPKLLSGVISRLRECYTEAYRVACGGKKAGSAKAIAAGAASNWEIFQAASNSNQTSPPRRRQQQQQCTKGVRGKNTATAIHISAGGKRKFKHPNDSYVGSLGSGGSGGGGGRSKTGKGSKKRQNR